MTGDDPDSGVEPTPGLVDRYVTILERHSTAVLVVFLVLTAVIGAGVFAIDEVSVSQFEIDSPEQRAADDVQSTFGTENRSYTQIVIRADNPTTDTVSTEPLLETMALQEAMRSNETVNATLIDDQATIGVGNAVAVATDPRLGFFGLAPIDAKTRVLEDRTDDQITLVLENTIDDDELSPEGQPPLSSLLPSGYDPGEDRADAQLVIVVHDDDASDADLLEAQRAIETLASEHVTTAETDVVAQELAFDRGSQAIGQSFSVVGPLALVLVTGALLVIYRDPFAVLRTEFGLGVALLWTGGLIGWLGLEPNQLLVAVPCLMVGLGIDYALHAEMRVREARLEAPSRSLTDSRRVGLAGVLVAIGATTATTMIGFLTGLWSDIAVLGVFGLVAAIGIGSTFLVFATFLPAIEFVLDGRTRGANGSPPVERRSIGSIRAIADPLRSSARFADRLPAILLAIALVLALGGAVAGTTVDTSSDRTDFLPEDPPAWTAQLPEHVQPAQYGVREDATFVDRTFDSPTEPTVDVLVTGNVTDPAALKALAAAKADARDANVTVEPADGTESVSSPITVIEATAEDNDTVARALDESDTTGDGIPDRNVEAVYDALYEADREAAESTIHRTDGGEYDAVRLTVTVDEDAEEAVVTAELRAVAASIDAEPGLEAIATGEPVLDAIQQRALLETVLVTFLLALVVIGAMVTALFRVRHRSWALGPITVVPVLLALAWLLGAMAALSIPYNAETALILAIAIGLGTDYTIHVTERFCQERSRGTRRDALETTIVETGGTILASAVTTAAAFGVLLLTVIPSLQRFGFITTLVIASVFIASVFVFPSLLVLWDRVR